MFLQQCCSRFDWGALTAYRSLVAGTAIAAQSREPQTWRVFRIHPEKGWHEKGFVLTTRFTNIIAGAVLLGATAFAVPFASAASDHNDDQDFGAYLYTTTCDSLATDKIIEDVGDLDMDDDMTKEWDRLGNGQEQPSKLYVEDEGVNDLTFDDLTENDYAIAVHAEDSKDADVIVCGDVTGEVQDGMLLIELHEVDDSGFEGRSHFAPDDDDDSEMEITTGIWTVGEVETLASPAASPTA